MDISEVKNTETKIDVDIDSLKESFDNDPKKKKQFQEALNTDRQTISKILNRKRRIEGGELLTAAAILNKDPFDFALKI